MEPCLWGYLGVGNMRSFDPFHSRGKNPYSPGFSRGSNLFSSLHVYSLGKDGHGCQKAPGTLCRNLGHPSLRHLPAPKASLGSKGPGVSQYWGDLQKEKKLEGAVTYPSSHDRLMTQLEPDPDFLTLNLLFFFFTSDSESSLSSPQGWWGTNGTESWFSE